jgi:hypothetical protein
VRASSEHHKETDHDLTATADAKLPIQAPHMRVERVLRNPQAVCHLRIVVAEIQETLDNLMLAGREAEWFE